MKKIWLSALLLAFVSSLSFAEVTVLAQGGVRFDIVNNVNQGARSETSVFNKWDCLIPTYGLWETLPTAEPGDRLTLLC